MTNTATNLVTPKKKSIFDNDRVIMPPLKRGKHSVVLLSYEEKESRPTATNPESNPYLACSVLADGETTPRLRSMFANEFSFATYHIANQKGWLEDQLKGQQVLDRLIKEAVPFNIWVVENADPQYADNWYYTEPQEQAALFTEEETDNVGMQL